MRTEEGREKKKSGTSGQGPGRLHAEPMWRHRFLSILPPSSDPVHERRRP
jgi:hypothetical protein